MNDVIKPTHEDVKDFIARNKEWIRRELRPCGYGVSRPDASKGHRLALRPQKITVAKAQKIEELRLRASKEGIELDVREIGNIIPL